MYGRMIHSHDGSLYSSPYGRTDDHYILSISRLGLNQMLLTAAEKRENVNLHFQKRINKVDLNGRLEFADGTDAEGDVLLGADGAFSKVRAQMARGRFNYQQHYIPHGYKGELQLVSLKLDSWKIKIFLKFFENYSGYDFWSSNSFLVDVWVFRK